MSCHFRSLASLVGLIIAVCFAQAAPAQSMSHVWKRWNWSILYPVDRASSIATQVSLVSLGPGRTLAGGQLKSIKLCGGLAADRVGDEIFSRQCLTQFARDVHHKTAKFGRFLCAESAKLGSIWGSIESEIAQAAERIECCSSARLEAESRQRELEYWSYYEDCDRWMPGFWAAVNDRQPDENRWALQATFFEDKAAWGLRRLVSTARAVIVDTGESATFAAERAALESFRLAGWRNEPTGPAALLAVKFTSVFSRLTVRATIDLGNGCRQLFGRAQTVLAVIPIEAIGFVLPD